MRFKPIPYILGVVAGILLVLLVGCSKNDEGNQNVTPVSEVYIKKDMPDSVAWGFAYTLVDSETGVEYIVIRGGNGVAITPRYDTDGQLKRSDE